MISMIQCIKLYMPRGQVFDMMVLSIGYIVNNVDIIGDIPSLYSNEKIYLSSDKFKDNLTYVIGKSVSYVKLINDSIGNLIIGEIRV